MHSRQRVGATAPRGPSAGHGRARGAATDAIPRAAGRWRSRRNGYRAASSFRQRPPTAMTVISATANTKRSWLMSQLSVHCQPLPYAFAAKPPALRPVGYRFMPFLVIGRRFFRRYRSRRSVLSCARRCERHVATFGENAVARAADSIGHQSRVRGSRTKILMSKPAPVRDAYAISLNGATDQVGRSTPGLAGKSVAARNRRHHGPQI